LAAARHDLVRARPKVGVLSGLPWRVLPDSGQYDFGVRSVDPRLFEAASMLGCQGTAQFYRVVLPASLPAIFTGLRLGLGFAWVVIVVGEMTGVQTGLGAIIMEARQLSRTEIVISGMIVIGIAGFISDRLVVLLGQWLLRWSPSHV